MKQTFKTLAAVLVGAGLVAFTAAPGACSDELCAMGGMLIKVDTVKDKAIDWGKDRRKAVIAGEGGDAWSVLALSKTDDDIAILVREGSVFFGVAGKGGENLDDRDLEKAFGRDLRTLTEVVKREMTELWKGSVVKVQGADITKINDAVALGTLEKGRDWEFTTQDCKPVDVDASDLK